ncbi:MAG TPA: multiheme c-type cytochrome [Phototrophicaceae bacterium]|nr:multiheme c-type cytochrome [Phototrophicaceae bacterium]
MSKRLLPSLFVLGFMLLLAGTASLVLALPPNQEATPESPPAAHAEYKDKNCADCHREQKRAWATGVHSVAYTKDSFQQAWQQVNGDPACLQCHTTNYEPPTGTYLAENVQCEACHGFTPVNHPPEELVIRTDASVCRDCHTATFAEFRQSKHAYPEDREALGCATCHDPHQQKLRFESVDELCLSCHKTAPTNYVHVQHRTMQTDLFSLNCASCHMYNSQRDEVHQLADHKMTVDTIPCSDCHQEMAKTGQFSVLENVTAAQERNDLRARAAELEVKITEVAPPPANKGLIQVLQGGLMGLFVGIVGVAVFWRGGRRKNGK